MIAQFLKAPLGYSPGDPVVKTSPSDAGSVDSIPGQGGKTPQDLEPKKPKHRTETILQQIQ